MLIKLYNTKLGKFMILMCAVEYDINSIFEWNKSNLYLHKIIY